MDYRKQVMFGIWDGLSTKRTAWSVNHVSPHVWTVNPNNGRAQPRRPLMRLLKEECWSLCVCNVMFVNQKARNHSSNLGLTFCRNQCGKTNTRNQVRKSVRPSGLDDTIWKFTLEKSAESPSLTSVRYWLVTGLTRKGFFWTRETSGTSCTCSNPRPFHPVTPSIRQRLWRPVKPCSSVTVAMTKKRCRLDTTIIASNAVRRFQLSFEIARTLHNCCNGLMALMRVVWYHGVA